jgi:hypothetical protein
MAEKDIFYRLEWVIHGFHGLTRILVFIHEKNVKIHEIGRQSRFEGQN